MTKVQVSVYGRHRRRRGYDNSSPDFRHGELKMRCVSISLSFGENL